MIDYYNIKGWLSWPLVRAHLCTLAIALSFNSTWKVPREALRYGGVSYSLVFTVAMVVVALPTTLLQLAIGQLSQQDAVGVWSAVPFFKGIGYIRILISYIGSIYTNVYVALTATYFLYSISNTIPFWECPDLILTQDGNDSYYNASTCLNSTFLAPVKEQPEYYIAVSLVIIALSIVFPFLLYNPVKLMKRIFYVFGPFIFILLNIVLFTVGRIGYLKTIHSLDDWSNYSEPKIWHSAVTQALLSSQIAGGFLILSGDTIYASTDVQWSALIITGTNVLISWMGVIFWFSVTGGASNTDLSPIAVLVQMYKATDEQELTTVWPLLVFAALFLSGIITMLTLAYPLYDRFRRASRQGWRIISFSSSLLGAAAALGVLMGRLPALQLLEDTVVPLLVNIATVLEILAFIFIYGWRVLVEDIEFLTGQVLVKYWVMGWRAAPGIILPFTVWWLVALILDSLDWMEPPWNLSGIIAAVATAIFILCIFAIVSVVKQVQYDFIGKLKSSFKPSRHWGPRDPITHYYWLARREEVDRGNLPSRYNRRQLGQLSGGPSFLNIPEHIDIGIKDVLTLQDKRRSNSDDWLYTGYRRQCLSELYENYLKPPKMRSKSLDIPSVLHVDTIRDTSRTWKESASSEYITPAQSATSVENVVRMSTSNINQ